MSRGKEGMSESAAKVGNVRALRPTPHSQRTRIAFSKQLDILRAFGAASEPDGHPMNNADVAGMVGLTAGTVSMINGFFLRIFNCCSEQEMVYVRVLRCSRYNRTRRNAETAPRQLAPAIQRSWFAQAFMPKLRFKAISEDEAVRHWHRQPQQDRITAARSRRYLNISQVCGIVARENGQIRLLQQQPNELQSLPTEPKGATTTTSDPCVPPPPRSTTTTPNFRRARLPGLCNSISAQSDMQELG